MADDATQQGAEDQSTVIVGNVERNNRLAELAEAARKARDEEIRDNGGEVVDTLGSDEQVSQESDKQDSKEEKTVVVEEKQQVTEEKASTVLADSTKEDYITVKVDGHEKQVLRSQVLDAGIRAVQKESAADRRLEEATRRLREVQAREQQIEEFLKHQSQPSVQDAAEIARRIRMGSDEEAIQAISALAGREQTTPDKIVTEVERRVFDTIQARSAVEKFQSEFSDILSDPYLTQLAVAEDARMLAGGDTRSYAERFTEIGNTLRNKLREWKGGKADVVVSADKQERKAGITNLPSASMRQPAPEQTKPKTPADIIEEMRKRRGQAA